MSLNAEERAAVVALEREKANSMMEEAIAISALGLWNTVANRVYYASFHAVSALLISHNLPASTHRGAVAMLGLHFIKTGIIPEELGQAYSQMQTLRERADYNCAFNVDEAQMKVLLEKSKLLIETIFQLIDKS